MKRRKNYEPKREKLWMLILRALVIVTVLVLAFAFGTREYLYQNVQRQALDQIQENTTRMQQYISRIQGTRLPKPFQYTLVIWKDCGLCSSTDRPSLQTI